MDVKVWAFITQLKFVILLDARNICHSVRCLEQLLVIIRHSKCLHTNKMVKDEVAPLVSVSP